MKKRELTIEDRTNLAQMIVRMIDEKRLERTGEIERYVSGGMSSESYKIPREKTADAVNDLSPGRVAAFIDCLELAATCACRDSM